MTPGPGMTLLQSKRAEILALAEKYGVTDVRVFGSVARGDDRPDSDVDLLVDLGKERSLLDLGGFQYDTQELLRRKVDVVMEDSLYHFFRSEVMKEARSL